MNLSIEAKVAIAVAVMAGPEGNFTGSCCPVARIFTLVPPISITSTFIIEVSRRIGEDNRGKVGSRLAAKVRSSRNSPCWQLSAVVHGEPWKSASYKLSSATPVSSMPPNDFKPASLRAVLAESSIDCRLTAASHRHGLRDPRIPPENDSHRAS